MINSNIETKSRTVDYSIKFKYDMNERSFEDASNDLLNVMFSCINLTSIQSYTLNKYINDGKYGTINLTFSTYGRKINIKELSHNDIRYDYKLYIDELDIRQEQEFFHIFNNDKYGTGYSIISDDISYCPCCSHRIFKYDILGMNIEGWAVCKKCHNMITVTR